MSKKLNEGIKEVTKYAKNTVVPTLQDKTVQTMGG